MTKRRIHGFRTALAAVFTATVLLVSLALQPVVAAPYQVLNIYLDADQTGTRKAGQAILKGMQLALAEAGNQIQGIPVSIQIRDHRGSSPRSLRHLKQFIKDDAALALFGGLHSPPLLAHKGFINSNGILVLAPWAAAGPITRSADDENWIYRLSIDDSKAGAVITAHAVDNEGFKKPYLLLEETGWGRSNLKTMTKALEQRGLAPAGVSWFNWGLGASEAKVMLRDIEASGADVIFMVANAPEGLTFAKAMLALPETLALPIRSHWGITGGSFSDELGRDLNKLDLAFIQTRFSFMQPSLNSFQRDVLNRTIEAFPEIRRAEDLRAPTGFIHAYDLMRLMLTAVEKVALTGDIAQDRRRVKAALEAQSESIAGLIKDYRRPFRPYKAGDPDAHEALRETDFAMGYYDTAGVIRLHQ